MSILEKNFDEGAIISLASLREKGIIKGEDNRVKVLGSVKATKKFKFEGVPVSASVKKNNG